MSPPNTHPDPQHPLSVSHDHRHEHGHHHEHRHHPRHSDPATLLRSAGSLLQASALARFAGAIGLLIPLWIAVFGLVS